MMFPEAGSIEGSSEGREHDEHRQQVDGQNLDKVEVLKKASRSISKETATFVRESNHAID